MTLARTTALLFCAMTSTAVASLEAPDWTHIRPATTYYKMIPAPGGGVLALSETRTTTFHDVDVLLERMTPEGETTWSLDWGGTKNYIDRLVDVAERPGGGAAILGRFFDLTDSGSTDIRVEVIQVDWDGEVVSTIQVPDTLYDHSSTSFLSQEKMKLAITSDGRSILSSNFSPEGTSSLFSLDPSGNVEWTFDFETISPNGNFVRILDLVVADGRAMVCGEIIQDTMLPKGMLAASFSPEGDLEWFRIFAAPIAYGFQNGHAAVDPEGNLVVCGDLVTSSFSTVVHVAKVDPGGTVVWEYDSYEDIQQILTMELNLSDDGDIYVSTSAWHTNDSFLHVLMLDSNGTLTSPESMHHLDEMHSLLTSDSMLGPDGKLHVVGSAWVGSQNEAQIHYVLTEDGDVHDFEAWSPSTSHDQAFSVVSDQSDNIYVCGRAYYIQNEGASGSIRAYQGSNCPADIDGNGSVNITDLLTLLAAYGTDDPGADLDDDGIVGVLDLLIVLDNWNGCEG